MSEMRRRAIAGLKVGDSFSVSRTFSEHDTMLFGEISRDYNPVHYDDRFAQAKNFRGRICHGLLVGGMLTEIGGQLAWLASEMHFRFRKPVFFGDTIKCHLKITEVDDRNRAKAEVLFENQNGETVIEANVAGIIPGLPDRKVMERMVAEGDVTNKLTSLKD
jgi:3-hydroxybutyryl-CoA dehydratase